MINGKVAGMDAFGKPGTFSKAFKMLLESYALDAIDWYDPNQESKALKRDVSKFQKAALAAEVGSHPAVGLGMGFRLESRKVIGFSLALGEQVPLVPMLCVGMQIHMFSVRPVLLSFYGSSCEGICRRR